MLYHTYQSDAQTDKFNYEGEKSAKCYPSQFSAELTLQSYATFWAHLPILCQL